MQAVSTNFKDAAVAATMTPVRFATIQLVDNQSAGASLTPSAAQSDSTYFPASQAVDGITSLGAKWAFADPFAEGAGGRFLADGTLYPIASPWEGGWQGVTLSDNSGNISGGEAFVITYGSVVGIATIQFWADSFLGYPVNFTVDYDPTGSAGWTNIVTVTGNTQTQYMYQIGSTVSVKKLRINITKINYGQQPARLTEFQGGLLIDVSAQLGSLDVLQERFPDQASIPVGNSSAGQLALSQDNTSGNWSPHRSASPYAANLRANRKIRVQVGYRFSNGTTELVPLGTYYSRRWSAPGSGPLATASGQDRMKKLRETQYRKCLLQINKTVDQCMQQALLDFGLGINEFVLAASSNVIPYAYAQPTQTFFDYLQKLAAVDGGVIYFDENDIFRFQDANYLHNNSTTSLLTFTDASGLIDASDDWNDGEVRNRIIVNINALKAAASAVIWTLQEALAVPAGGSLTVNVAFQNPATGVTTPVFTAGAHITLSSWTAYAYGVVMVFANSGGASENVTACTISGQELKADGQALAIAETSSVTNNLETPREQNFNNPFVQTSATAGALAANLLGIYSDPPAKLHVETVGLPHLELGDRVTVNSSKLGINSDFWVIRHQFVDDGSFHSSLDLYAVV